MKSPYIARLEKKCPICKTTISQKIIKPYFYMLKEFDVDNKPQKINWFKLDEKQGEKYNPKFYFMSHCYNCKFTASFSIFHKPIERYYIKNKIFIKKFMVDQKKESVKFVTKTLIEDIDLGKDFIDKFDSSKDYLNIFQAIKLHLLGIFQLMQYEKTIVNKDSKDLGTYNLRLAWLYRDIKENKEWNDKYSEKLDNLLKTLLKHWKEIPTTEDTALNNVIKFYNNAISKSETVATVTIEMNLLTQIFRIYLKTNKIADAYKTLLLCISKAKQFEIKASNYVHSVENEQKNRITKNIMHMTEFEKKKHFEQPARDKEAKRISHKMLNESKGMSNKLGIIKDVFSDYKEEFDKDQTKKANEIIASMPNGTSKKDIRKNLEEADIAKRIIYKIVPKKTPRKKFLGIF